MYNHCWFSFRLVGFWFVFSFFSPFNPSASIRHFLFFSFFIFRCLIDCSFLSTRTARQETNQEGGAPHDAKHTAGDAQGRSAAHDDDDDEHARARRDASRGSEHTLPRGPHARAPTVAVARPAPRTHGHCGPRRAPAPPPRPSRLLHAWHRACAVPAPWQLCWAPR